MGSVRSDLAQVVVWIQGGESVPLPTDHKESIRRHGSRDVHGGRHDRQFGILNDMNGGCSGTAGGTVIAQRLKAVIRGGQRL